MPCSPAKVSLLATCLLLPRCPAAVVATWLFDEQCDSYPSTILNDSGPHAYVMALGRGARLVKGRFGNALEPAPPPPLAMRGTDIRPDSASAKLFGLVPIPIPQGRKMQPLWWQTATFAALLTSGEKHLRSGGFANATDTRLNLGAFDWTVEFWFHPGAGNSEGVVFEVGEGPRAENDRVTRLSLAAGRRSFQLLNAPAGVALIIPTDSAALAAGSSWRHLAFVYTAAERQVRHYVDGRLQPLPSQATIASLGHRDEAYFTVGRDSAWGRPLPGAIDELRFRDDTEYSQTPGSFSRTYSSRMPPVALKKGPPLLFGKSVHAGAVIDLGTRKHLFIDDAFIASQSGIAFVPQPPRRMEKVADEVRGHLSVVEDESGLIRLYFQGPQDHLAVMTSRDGVHWSKPEDNVVLPKPVGLGVVFLDPNAPPESRYKYVSGIRRQGIFVFWSADGYHFQQNETAALPFSAGSQSATYYDDQRQVYVSHHRSDYGMMPSGSTRRRFVMSEVKDLFEPWPFERITPERTREVSQHMSIQASKLDPWFLDNGPLAPPGFGIDLPTIIETDPRLDPPATDVYVTKAIKYPWAPDTYLAFPAIYFHYQKDGPAARQFLGAAAQQRGSGVIETQIAVSRDGLAWHRYPRPAYVPVAGDEHMLFVTHGLVRRANEIWQFVGGHGGSGTNYHSPYSKVKPAPLYRYIQRLDGFVAAEAAYGGGELRTKPFRFEGKHLKLNIDTGAAGYAQVGFLDAQGKSMPGFDLDESVYINGDFIATEARWLKTGADVSSLSGKTVRLVFRMRGAKLYAMQFE